MKRSVIVHLAGAVVSATVWGLATQMPFVPLMIFLSEMVGLWFPPGERAKTSLVRHVARAILFGGTWAAIGLLVFR